MNKIKKNQGITLIALVLTIIILLILASISIAMLTGDNGILTQAQRAKRENERASEEELRRLTVLEASTNVTNTNYNGVTIPAGFAVSQVKGENSVENGLVIIDKNGNEFVWIPVDGEELKYEKHIYASPDIDDTDTIVDTGNGNWITQRYRKYNNWIDEGGNKESVEKYGGFYVARYEAGVPEIADFYACNEGDMYCTNDTIPSKNVSTYIPVSKKNVQVWNYISQENSKIVADSMYKNNLSVESNLIDGYAWDTITQWLYNSGYDVTNSKEWGNYYSTSFDFSGLYAFHEQMENLDPIIAKTYNKGNASKVENTYLETAAGVVERNKANNIYDFAGNFFERTTETTKDGDKTYVALRGGGFNSTDQHAACCLRLGNSEEPIWAVGFRVVLYLK